MIGRRAPCSALCGLRLWWISHGIEKREVVSGWTGEYDAFFFNRGKAQGCMERTNKRDSQNIWSVMTVTFFIMESEPLIDLSFIHFFLRHENEPDKSSLMQFLSIVGS